MSNKEKKPLFKEGQILKRKGDKYPDVRVRIHKIEYEHIGQRDDNSQIGDWYYIGAVKLKQNGEWSEPWSTWAFNTMHNFFERE